MFCKKCGVRLDDDSKFCHICGTEQPARPVEKASAHTWRCDRCGHMIDHVPCIVCARGNQIPVPPYVLGNDRYRCPICNHEQSRTDYCRHCGQIFRASPKPKPTPATAQYPMAYFNFCIYFLFFFSGGSCLASGTLYFALSGQLDEPLYILFGMSTIAQGVLLFVLRFLMAYFKRGAVTWFIWIRWGSLGINLFFNLLISVDGFAYSIIPLLITALITSAEVEYFRNRESLFVN